MSWRRLRDLAPDRTALVKFQRLWAAACRPGGSVYELCEQDDDARAALRQIASDCDRAAELIEKDGALLVKDAEYRRIAGQLAGLLNPQDGFRFACHERFRRALHLHLRQDLIDATAGDVEDAVGQQQRRIAALEAELGQVAVTIQTGFPHVAKRALALLDTKEASDEG